MNNTLNGIARLSDWGVIRAHGDDAAKFLHGQLTQDFSLLGSDQARLAGLCSAKGRLLASLIGFKLAPDELLLLCKRDILANTLKRLSQFVLRAKLVLSDASDAYSLYGLMGSVAQAQLAPQSMPWQRVVHGAASVIALYPALGTQRALWVAPVHAPEPVGAMLGIDSWQWAEVHSGIAMVSEPIVEAFVPQMLNYESVGGVNFKKGCYPGQEVVARSQFRGTLKRRSFLLHSDVPLAVGSDVFHSSDPEQACGRVAAAAAAPGIGGGWDALVSMTTSAVESGTLHAGSVHGPTLKLLPLPYPLLADI